MSDAGVPIVVTYRKIIKKPKIHRHRQFVGPFQMVKNILARTLELIEEAAFETKTEVLDPGQSVSVHWAISVEDPWEVSTGREKNLIAYRMLNDIPPSGVHFEVISPSTENPSQETPPPETTPQAEENKELTPEQFRVLRLRHEAQAGNGARSRVNAGLTRPVTAPQYEPRKVKTIEEEVAEAPANENTEDLGRSGSLGEDD